MQSLQNRTDTWKDTPARLELSKKLIRRGAGGTKISEAFMRLVCPKCVAQYEVAEQEIPEEGREVQCANCEHIWFQDRVVMFTEKRESAEATDNSVQADDSRIFEDLDRVGDVPFQHHRNGVAAPAADLSDPEKSETAADDIENILADDTEEFDEGPDDADDLPMEFPKAGRPLTDDVLEVLRKEAEFSSNRNETPAEVETADTGEHKEHVLEEPLETDLDELSAFLSSYETDSTKTETEAEEETPERADDPQEPGDHQDPDFDPLSDLDEIRSQLDSIRENTEDVAEDESPVEADYTPVLPQDTAPGNEDTTRDIEIPDLDAALSSVHPAQDPDTPEAPTDTPDAVPFDDYEETRPRRAFRADLASADPLAEEPFFTAADDTPPTPQDPATDGAASAIPAAVALGNMRPRTSGSKRPVRNIAEPEDLIGATPPEPAKDPAAALSHPTRPAKSTRSERPAPPAEAPQEAPTSRKELLPDVEELDSTLRGEAPTMQAEQDIPDTGTTPATKSFGRAFVWTLLILAILVALYVMRPMIIAALPASGVVLNPYGSFIDSMRLMIESLIG
jgi:predicted Zn finger-like uncharacterized protein